MNAPVFALGGFFENGQASILLAREINEAGHRYHRA
jgi:hypothetical protein